MSNSLVSIIIPVYNVQSYLESCLNSVALQTYCNLEVLLIDDGSTDESGKICDAFSEKDSRFKTIHKKNGGVSSARNEGLKNIHGEFVAFVDSDDTIDSDYIEAMLDGMIKYEVNFVRAHFKRNGKALYQFFAEAANKPLLLDVAELKNLQLLAYTGGIMMKTSCIGENLFDSSIYLGEDKLFLSTCFFQSLSTKILLLNKPFYNYTCRENSASNSEFNDKWLTLQAAADKIVEKLEPYPNARKLTMLNKKVFYLMLYKKLDRLRNNEGFVKKLNELKTEIVRLRRLGYKPSSIKEEIIELSDIYGGYKFVTKVRKIKRFVENKILGKDKPEVEDA